MDFSKIFIKDANPTKMGGQAVMEGIMMKGADRSAVAVRRSDGTINIKETPLPKKKEWMKWPVLRGVMAFIDSLVTGVRTLMYSASVVEEDMEDEEAYEPGKVERWITEKFGEKGLFKFLLYTSVAIALVVSVGVFVLLPTWVVGFCKSFISSEILLNLIEGVLRILMFIVYVALIAQMPDIKRVFQYHGAEHQTIHCYENGLELTPENCAKFETLHPRCGTSFIMFVFIISLLLFSFLGWPNIAVRLISRLLLIPVVAGLSYELLRWAGRSDNLFVKVLSVPGLLMQKLTTRVPDESMLEVAIAAVNVCLSDEPPMDRVFDTDGKGNLVDRIEWQIAQEMADGDISPEAKQAMTGEQPLKQSQEIGAGTYSEEESPEAAQETAYFAKLLSDLEIPDPPEKLEVQTTAEAESTVENEKTEDVAQSGVETAAVGTVKTVGTEGAEDTAENMRIADIEQSGAKTADVKGTAENVRAEDVAQSGVETAAVGTEKNVGTEGAEDTAESMRMADVEQSGANTADVKGTAENARTEDVAQSGVEMTAETQSDVQSVESGVNPNDIDGADNGAGNAENKAPVKMEEKPTQKVKNDNDSDFAEISKNDAVNVSGMNGAEKQKSGVQSEVSVESEPYGDEMSAEASQGMPRTLRGHDAALKEEALTDISQLFAETEFSKSLHEDSDDGVTADSAELNGTKVWQRQKKTSVPEQSSAQKDFSPEPAEHKAGDIVGD